MGINMVFSAEELLNFDDSGVELDPAFVYRGTQTVRREPSFNSQSVTAATDSRLDANVPKTFAGGRRCESMGNFQKKFVQAVHILLQQTEPQGKNLVGLKMIAGFLVERLNSSSFAHDVGVYWRWNCSCNVGAHSKKCEREKYREMRFVLMLWRTFSSLGFKYKNLHLPCRQKPDVGIAGM